MRTPKAGLIYNYLLACLDPEMVAKVKPKLTTLMTTTELLDKVQEVVISSFPVSRRRLEYFSSMAMPGERAVDTEKDKGAVDVC